MGGCVWQASSPARHRRPAALAAALVACGLSHAALAREARRLPLRPVPATVCGERDGERVAESTGFGPEAPDGYLSASLDWRDPDSTRLFFTIETKAGRYRDGIPMRLPANVTHAEIQTIAGKAGVLVFGLVAYYKTNEPGVQACQFAFTACRLSASGAPECSPGRVVAEGHSCPGARRLGSSWTDVTEEEESFLRADAQGRAQLLGQPISWDAGSFRALPGPLPPEGGKDWARPAHLEFSRFHGMRGVDFVTAPDERQHRIVLETSAGCFWDRRWVTPTDGIRPAPTSLSGILDKLILGKILVVTWSWGVGLNDPPENFYMACRGAFMACVLDGGDRPFCSAPITVARTRKRCRPGGDEYEVFWRAPPAEISPGGTGFSIEGRRYEIVRPPK